MLATFASLAVGALVFRADAAPSLQRRANLPAISRDETGGLLPQAEFEACTGGARTVVLMVDADLNAGIRAGLDQFEKDICADGYSVLERRADFGTPPELRSYLSSLWARPNRQLVGAFLIGNLPHAYQWVTLTSSNPSIPSSSEEVISFQYYADLDGGFGKSAGYTSAGGHTYSYDIHTGNVGWEIWVGVLPMYGGNTTRTIEALRRFFIKDHAYRTGGSTIPRAFLEVVEHFTATTAAQSAQIMNDLKTGQYAWTPFSTSPGARIYFDSPPAGLSVAQGYADLAAGVADFTDVDAHGYWGASGQLTIAKVESTPVKTVFFWSNGCAVGDLDHAENFLTSVLYSPTSTVLVAKGTTNNSGGLGNNSNGFFGHNVATSMSVGKSFGQATLDHVNVPLIAPWSTSREFHFGTGVVLGDPTLRLR
jgi:hypothetical protein